MRLREEADRLRVLTAEKQADEAAKLKRFVERFGAKATKAKQAQSRAKRLEKLNAERVFAPDSEHGPRLRFRSRVARTAEVVDLHGVAGGYDRVLFSNLDLDMRHALEVALQAYDGALVLVSHDRHMLRNTAEELLLVHLGQVEEYSEDLDGYERWILSSYRQTTGQNASAADTSRREKRQQAAEQRDKQRPLQKLLAKTESAMEKVSQELLELQERLGDAELYTDDHKHTLADILRREGELKVRAEELDDTWLGQQQQLEELE